MKINKTQIINAVYSIVCLLAALTTLPPGLLPEKYRAIILSTVGIATWLKSHWNLFITPDGKPLDNAPTSTN